MCRILIESCDRCKLRIARVSCDYDQRFFCHECVDAEFAAGMDLGQTYELPVVPVLKHGVSKVLKRRIARRQALNGQPGGSFAEAVQTPQTHVQTAEDGVVAAQAGDTEQTGASGYEAYDTSENYAEGTGAEHSQQEYAEHEGEYYAETHGDAYEQDAAAYQAAFEEAPAQNAEGASPDYAELEVHDGAVQEFAGSGADEAGYGATYETMEVQADAVAPASEADAWETFYTDDGTPYYFNHTTGVTQWEAPV